MANLINWFKNKIVFLNDSLPAINDVNLNNIQVNIEQDLSDFIQGDLNNYISGMPIGSGCDYFGTEPPTGFLFADGSELSRTDYAELFAIIGIVYGEGDGETTFNLPDKRERVSIMKGDNNSLGEKVGSDSITLSENNLPKVVIQDIVTNVKGNTSNTWGVSKTTPSVTSINQTKGSASFGSDTPTPIDNRQSSLVCNYIIKVK